MQEALVACWLDATASEEELAAITGMPRDALRLSIASYLAAEAVAEEHYHEAYSSSRIASL